MRDAYLPPWSTYVPRSQLVEALHLVEALVCVRQLISYGTLVALEELWKQEMLDGVANRVKPLVERL